MEGRPVIGAKIKKAAEGAIRAGQHDMGGAAA